MQIQETTHAQFVTLAPLGDLDANSSIEMDEKIQEVIDRGTYNIHVDCSQLKYISSAGLGLFISFRDKLQQGGGKFVFSGMSEPIYKTFDLLGLPQVMTIVVSGEEVEKEFQV